MASEPLCGRGILVTRPREQAAQLARLIERAGGRVHLLPAIEIEDLPAPEALGRLHGFDLAVFVSPTAAAKVMDRLKAWPSAVRAAAVGAGTRRELERRGVAQVIAPTQGADSEALLVVPELKQMAGKRVVIFRGEEGRALLGDTLRARGASVEYAACYRRARPRHSGAAQPEGIDVVTVSSSQGLANLLEMLGADFLRARPLFVPHPRVAEAARAHGVREVITAGTSDEEMLDALVAYFRPHG